MSACVCSSLYSVSALTVLTAGALSSSAKSRLRYSVWSAKYQTSVAKRFKGFRV